MTVEIHEFDADLLEGALGEQMTLDPRQRFVGIVVSLLDQTQLLALRLVQPRFHAVGGEGGGMNWRLKILGSPL